MSDYHSHELGFICVRKSKSEIIDDDLDRKETLEDFTMIEYIGNGARKVKLFTGNKANLSVADDPVIVETINLDSEELQPSTSSSVVEKNTNESSLPVISQVIHLDNP